MQLRKRKKFDRILTGWLLGTIAPLIVLFLTWQIEFNETEFANWVRNLWQMKIFLKLMSLCVFPNLGLFFLFYRNKYDMAARGVIMATFLYAFVVLFAKLI